MGLMAALAEMYEQPSVVNKVYLMKRLFLLRMAEDCPFTTHLSEFNTVVDQLTSVEIEFAEEVRALLLLQQMPESWNQAVTSISNSSGKGKLRFNEVVSMILTEEVRRKSSESSDTGSSGSALSLEQRGRSQKRGDQNQNQNRNRSNSKKRSGKSAI